MWQPLRILGRCCVQHTRDILYTYKHVYWLINIHTPLYTYTHAYKPTHTLVKIHEHRHTSYYILTKHTFTHILLYTCRTYVHTQFHTCARTLTQSEYGRSRSTSCTNTWIMNIHAITNTLLHTRAHTCKQSMADQSTLCTNIWIINVHANTHTSIHVRVRIRVSRVWQIKKHIMHKYMNHKRTRKHTHIDTRARAHTCKQSMSDQEAHHAQIYEL